MNKKILILVGVLTASIAIGCISASASTITQDTYNSDDIFFPEGQYQMNFNFEIGASASTTNNYNKVIYNNVIERDIAEVNVSGTYYEEIYKIINYQESQDQFENLNLVTYLNYVEPYISSSNKQINTNVEISDSFLVNNDLYFRFTDFFYKSNIYQGHSLKWTNVDNYYSAWLQEDFDIYDDVGFYDVTIFKLENNTVVPYRYIDAINSTNMFAYYNNGTISFDTYLIETLKNTYGDFYAFYINDCVLKMKELYYYVSDFNLQIFYYHYDDDMFGYLGNFDYSTPEINVSDFIISSVGGFMDFQIIPGFSFGLLLSFILTLALIVWIIKVFMGG